MASKQVSCQRYKGKVIVITGSGQGIGYGMALRMAQEGGHVVINDLQQEKVDEAVNKIKQAGGSAIGVRGDATDLKVQSALVQTALQSHNKIDVLVHNVVTGLGAPSRILLEVNSATWDAGFKHVKSSLELTKQAVPHMTTGGAILFISSASAYEPAFPIPLYAISKLTVLGLSKALAHELASKGIRVNTIAPGPILTPAMDLIKKNMPDFYSSMLRVPMMKRMGTMDELGATAAFLCSDDASYITGESVVVGGGGYSRL